MENQQILKRCFDTYQGTWSKEETFAENDYYKVLHDFFDGNEKRDEKTNDAYLNKIRKCKFKKIALIDLVILSNYFYF